MLQFDGEKWVLYKRKVSYKAPYEFYTDDEVEIAEDWIDVEIETIDLDFEQLKRFEQVQYFENAGVDDLREYIMIGKMPVDDWLLSQEIAREQIEYDKIKVIKEMTDFENASLETLENLYFLKKNFKHGIFLEKNDLVEYEGGLYIVNQDHIASDIYPPGTAPSLYTVKRKGTGGDGLEPDPWEQPTHAENAYMKGDRVMWTDGKVYESTIDNNVWSPDAYPQGWTEVP